MREWLITYTTYQDAFPPSTVTIISPVDPVRFFENLNGMALEDYKRRSARLPIGSKERLGMTGPARYVINFAFRREG